MKRTTIWVTIAVLSAFIPTVSMANQPSTEVQAPASTSIKIDPAVNSTQIAINPIADLDINAKLSKLTSSCNNIADPMACMSGARGILGNIGGTFGNLGTTAIDNLTSSVTGVVNRGLADLAGQFPFLAGLLGQGNVATTPTSQEVAKTNVDDVQKIAASVLAVKGKAMGDVLQRAQDTGEYTPGVANEMIQQSSKAIAASMTGKAALQANQQNITAAAADAKISQDIAGVNYDSSLDALTGTNQSLAVIARGQERINSALIESKTTQGQLLEQTTLVRDTINESNIRNDVTIQRNIETQASLQCFQASIYRPKLTCK